MEVGVDVMEVEVGEYVPAGRGIALDDGVVRTGQLDVFQQDPRHGRESVVVGVDVEQPLVPTHTCMSECYIIRCVLVITLVKSQLNGQIWKLS